MEGTGTQAMTKEAMTHARSVDERSDDTGRKNGGM
jgi:hypothetical protein